MKTFLDFRKLVMEETNKAAMEQLTVLKQEMIDGVYMRMMGFAKSSLILRQLHQLQKDSIRLSDWVYRAQKEPEASQFYTHAQHCLIEILESLQRYKFRFFDREQKIPLYLMEQVGPTLREKTLLLKASMKKGKVDNELQAIVLSALQEFRSYQHMEYLVIQVDEWISRSTDESLINSLLNKGFNSNSFSRYYMLKISEKVNAYHQTTEQLETLYEFLSELKRMPKQPYRRYDSAVPNLRQTLITFVETEIKYLMRKRQLHAAAIAPTAVANPNYRIKTSLSVDGLAYLLRLMVETQVIEANPKSELIAFIAAHVQTCGNGEQNLSTNSITTKYKQVTQFTAGRVNALLLKMAKQVQDNFNI